MIADLQGPKLRVGTFEDGKVHLKKGQHFRLDNNPEPGRAERVYLGHPEIFKALQKETILLLDDGNIALRVISFDDTHAVTEVLNDGILSNRKGLNVPNVMLPISALTEKDYRDLDFALELGVDFVALSFVQNPKDVLDAKQYIKGRAGVLSKLEKPLAIRYLEDIIEASDGVMVARGDLGVELPPEDVPAVQRQIIRACRKAGRPVIVATQMLESMVHNPTPTRAEASDVATAIYDGVDAVTLSAESASGQYPQESVMMMDRIIKKTEQDPFYIDTRLNEDLLRPHTVTDSIAAAAHQVAKTINVKCIVTFSQSGFTTLRVSRERPLAPILSLTPRIDTARRMALVWGVHPSLVDNAQHFSQMVDMARKQVKDKKMAHGEDQIIVTAGVPFGKAGGTNILRVAAIDE